MKICLVNPPRLLRPMSATQKSAPPLGLAYIASILNNLGHQVCAIDCIAEAPYKYHRFNGDIVLNGLNEQQLLQLIPNNVDVIGFSLMFSGNWLHNRILIDAVGERFPNATIIAGGEHVTAAANLCFEQTKHLKACVLGEGEETIAELINAIEKNTDLSSVAGIAFRDDENKVRHTPARVRIRNLDEIPLPQWDIFPIEKYTEHDISFGINYSDIVSLPLLATRGCPYTCTFCSSPQMWGTKYQMRSVQSVADEMELYYNKYKARNFDFYDLTAIINKHWIIELCKTIKDRNLQITWQIPAGTRSEAIDAEVAKWLYKSGCKIITYAPESGSEETLKAIKKKISIDKMLASIRYSRNAGMNVKINFIIGFPNERHLNIWHNIWFLIKASYAGANDMAPAVFSPYPGSELYNKLKNNGEINERQDAYFEEIINVDTFWDIKFYNQNIPTFILRFYLFFYLFVFYTSNFLFYPGRLIKTIKNLVSHNYESRGEMTLGELMKRRKVKIEDYYLRQNEVITEKI